MHFSRELLYVLLGFTTGGLLGTLNGIFLFGAWLMGWILPVPEYIASNDLLAKEGKARSKLAVELPFAWSDRYDFTRDKTGNVSYKPKVPYAGDGEG